jgi:hypothetical protein
VPSNWEAFVDLARSYTGDGRFGFRYPYTDPFFSYGWWHAHGGCIFASSGAEGWDDRDLGLGGEPGHAAARVLRDAPVVTPRGHPARRVPLSLARHTRKGAGPDPEPLTSFEEDPVAKAGSSVILTSERVRS